MATFAPATPAPPATLWAGRVLSGLFVVFMLGASIAPKLLGMPVAGDTIEALGWSRDDRIDVVITTGGTGFTGRDVTPDALEPIFEKRMDGFSAVFHRISYEKIGVSTIQSRATGGVVNATFVFVLPGSPGACKDAWDGILKAQLDYRHMPCNFVEIMPRLDEHLRRGKS